MTRMRKMVFVSFCAALLLVAVSAVRADDSGSSPASLAPQIADSPLLTPEPELMFGCHSHCLGSYTTAISGGPSDWGMGASCTEATNNLNNSVFNTADSHCIDLGFDGACNVTVVVTTGCYWSSMKGMYQIDGYGNHSCIVTICIDPPPPY